MSGGNNWLARQRKTELLDLADAIGLTNYEKLLKSDLESAIDDHVSQNVNRFQNNPKLKDYFKSRARAEGSPVKKEPLAYEPKLSKRRQSTKVAEEVTVDPESPADSSSSRSPSPSSPEPVTSLIPAHASDLVPSLPASITTPARNGALSLASRLQLPATPADVASAVESGTLAVRSKLSDLYSESGVPEAAQSTREFLSTVHSVLSTIAIFELYKLRQELLPDRYAFTFPAISWLGTAEHPVKLPDMFALVTSGFWIPALTWFLTSFAVPAAVGWFYNLGYASGAKGGSGRGAGRNKGNNAAGGYEVDPLVFSIVKGLLTYVIYGQGVTFGGLISEEVVGRINGALYSGWKGVLVGSGVAGVTAVYDAVLRK